jgi:hypothetical protein
VRSPRASAAGTAATAGDLRLGRLDQSAAAVLAGLDGETTATLAAS